MTTATVTVKRAGVGRAVRVKMAPESRVFLAIRDARRHRLTIRNASLDKIRLAVSSGNGGEIMVRLGNKVLLAELRELASEGLLDRMRDLAHGLHEMRVVLVKDGGTGVSRLRRGDGYDAEKAERVARRLGC